MTATENRRWEYLWETPYKKGGKSDFSTADPKIQTQKKTPEGVFFFGFGGAGGI
jgi:hypothetical protein